MIVNHIPHTTRTCAMGGLGKTMRICTRRLDIVKPKWPYGGGRLRAQQMISIWNDNNTGDP